MARKIEISEEDILQGLREGKSYKKIGQEHGTNGALIRGRVAKMNQQEIEKARLEGILKKVEQHGKKFAEEEAKKAEARVREEEIILQGIEEGKTQKQIGKLLGGLSNSAISIRISKMDQTKVEEARVKAAKLKAKPESKAGTIEEIILQGIEEGKTQKEIGKLLGGLSQTAIGRKISKIDPTKEAEARAKAEAKFSVNETRHNTKISYEKMAQKLNDRTLTKEDIENYRKQLDYKINPRKKEIELMINIYIKTNQSSKAINLLNSLINDEYFKVMDKQKLIEMKQQVEITQKKQRIRTYLTQGVQSYSEIARLVGVTETFVIQVKKAMDEKNNKDNKGNDR